MKAGDKVVIISDNDSYDEWRDQILVIDTVSTSELDHPGYDTSVGENLYDLYREVDGKAVPFSLYDYEVEESI